MPDQEVIEPGLKIGRIEARRQTHVGVVVIAAPTLQFARPHHQWNSVDGAKDFKRHVRIVGQVLDDRGYRNVGLIHQIQGLSDRVLIAEITCDCTFSHYDVRRPGQRGLGIATKEFEIKKLENISICDNQVSFTYLNVTA